MAFCRVRFLGTGGKSSLTIHIFLIYLLYNLYWVNINLKMFSENNFRFENVFFGDLLQQKDKKSIFRI